MSCSKAPAGWTCTRVEGHEGPCAAWPIKNPPPLPVARPVPRTVTPKGGTLAPLGRVEPIPPPEVFTTEEPPTEPRATAAVVNRLIRNYMACAPEDQRLIEALAIRLRPGVFG